MSSATNDAARTTRKTTKSKKLATYRDPYNEEANEKRQQLLTNQYFNSPITRIAKRPRSAHKYEPPLNVASPAAAAPFRFERPQQKKLKRNKLAIGRVNLNERIELHRRRIEQASKLLETMDEELAQKNNTEQQRLEIRMEKNNIEKIIQEGEINLNMLNTLLN